MGYQSLLFQSDAIDLPAMLAMARSAWQTGDYWEMLPGDLIWQRYNHEDHIGNWHQRVALWRNEMGELAGFAIYYIRTADLVFSIPPELQHDRELIGSMLAWGEDRAKHFDAGGKPLVVSALESSKLAKTFLEMGLELSNWAPMRITTRTLEDLSLPNLPAGYQVRPLTGPEEFEQRVGVHHDAFRHSIMTVEAYRRLRQQPGYDAELDLVCVAPDGTLTSYCLAWFDPELRTGLFEPVGAREAYRGRGLTKAVLQEALIRLRQRGAERAFVSCETDNPNSCHLYEAAGFRDGDRFRYYERPDR